MTTSNLLCPQCQTPLRADDRNCSGCGLDMAVVTLMLEHSAAASAEKKAAPYVPDILVPRLGEFLLKRQFLTEAQLQQALQHQQQRSQSGQPIMLGEALIELGLLTREKLDRAILAQVLELQAALQASNRQLEQRVAQRTKELEQALKKVNEINQLKSDFVANISHELRTPLAQIKGYVVLMADGTLGRLNEEQAEAMRSTNAAVERLENIIEDLIRFASAARGELVVTSAAFCLSDIAQSIVNRVMPKATKGSVRLVYQLPLQPVFVNGDVEKLSWVIGQLLDNAVKFTPSGGAVQLHIKAEPAQSVAHVAVQDTGIGIPEERMSELFEPFHQLDSSSTRRYGGTGLGLALVRRIVKAHGFDVKVASARGKGSIFSFDLPLAQPK